MTQIQGVSNYSEIEPAVDPLKALTEEQAIAVSAETDGLAIAVGQTSESEWLRMEGNFSAEVEP